MTRKDPSKKFYDLRLKRDGDINAEFIVNRK